MFKSHFFWAYFVIVTFMRPSIRHVAEHAQVSPMTVSRVLRGRKGLVADDTFNRVMASVRELNYVPVVSAMQNRHIQTCSIGVVPFYSNVSKNPIDAQTFEGLCAQARLHSYDLLVMLREDEDWMSRASSRFLDRRNDGFIFISPDVGQWKTILQELPTHDIPVVICYRRDVPEGVAWVDPDNAEIMRLAVGHLHQHGHTRLAYVSGPATPVPFDDNARQEAFKRETEALGLSDATIIEGATETWQLKPNVLAALRESGATGVVCVNDYLALQLWEAAEKAGLHVPLDLSLVGVDDQDTKGRGLTSIGFSYAQVGKLAVEAWVALQGGKDAALCCRVVPVHLVERASVRALQLD